MTGELGNKNGAEVNRKRAMNIHLVSGRSCRFLKYILSLHSSLLSSSNEGLKRVSNIREVNNNEMTNKNYV